MHYYNENDPFAAAWLAELMKAGLIPYGQIDTRSIADVRGGELEGFIQCHFFAGIGGWPYALRLAAWPEDRPVWTGSCPCQPFSVAGKGKGTADERHLWPEFHRLIAECRPPVVFGEQVASKDGRQWLAGVRTDLEALGYAVGGADLCAAGVGAPHIRQRLYWVADATYEQQQHGCGNPGPRGWNESSDGCGGSGMADAVPTGRTERGTEPGDRQVAGSSGDGGLVNALRSPQERQRPLSVPMEPEQEAGRSGHADVWARSVLIGCADGKSRRVEPEIPLLAHGVSNRVGKLRGFGNAIVPQVAAAFIEAYREVT